MIPYYQYVFRANIQEARVFREGDGEGTLIEGDALAGWLDLSISGLPDNAMSYDELRSLMEAGVEPEAARINARLSFSAQDVPGAETGTIDLQAWGSGIVAQAGEEWSIEAHFSEARVLYQSMVDERGFEEWEDIFVTRPDVFEGSLGGTVRLLEEQELPVLELFKSSLLLELREPLGWSAAAPAAAPGGGPAGQSQNRVTSIEVFLDQTWTARVERNTRDMSVAPCPAGGATQRTLAIQFVLFRDTPANGPVVTADAAIVANQEIAADQIAAANEVWGQACITIDNQTVGPAFKRPLTTTEASNPRLIKDKHSSGAGIIPVFLVRNDLQDYGGGACFNPGTALAKVVISTNVAPLGGGAVNRWLLAHELGHVFNGWHPDPNSAPDPGLWGPFVPRAPLWTADPATVLQPSGAASNPVPSFNSPDNCWAAWSSLNPALKDV